jgi:type IV pilus assembly protein PilF
MNVAQTMLDRFPQWLCAMAWVLVTVVGLPGCVVVPPEGGGNIVTDSDEPDVRRRARLRLELAMGYYEQDKISIALDEIKQSLANDPSYADAYNVRGLIYLRLKDLNLAEDSFRRALSINPKDPSVLHNYGWLLCQQSRISEAVTAFTQAIENPNYTGRAKTWMTQGLCQIKAGKNSDAEYSFGKSFELDAANPITSYNLAMLLYQRNDFVRSQFYIRRLNNSQLANSESLWLGIKVERRLGNRAVVEQLAGQLRNRYPKSHELELFERGAFNE